MPATNQDRGRPEMAEGSKLARRLSTQDASFLYNETANGPLHIGILQTFDGEIEPERLIEHFARRAHLLPRFRQRVVFAPFNLAHATLEDDPDFAPANHIRHHVLPRRFTDAEMTRAAILVNETMLDRNRPLWELHLFEGLEGGRSALLWKIHHSIVDGVSALQVISAAMDLRPDAPAPPPEEPPWSPQKLPGTSKSLLDAASTLVRSRLDEMSEAGRLLSSPADLAERSAAMAAAARQMLQMMSRPIVAAPWNAGLVGHSRSLAYLGVSFGDLRAIRGSLGGTVNDVVLTILSEGAARYLKHHKVASQGFPLRIGCPVNVRRESESGAMGNRVSMMFPELGAAPMDSIERYQSVVRETERIKAAREPQGMDLLVATADAVAPSLQELSSRMAATALEAATRLSKMSGGIARVIASAPAGINFVATNVPGPQVALYLAGRRMCDFVGLVPLAGTLGYGVAIVSYNQRLFFGLMAEPRMMPDVEFMKSCIADSFEELKTAALKAAPAEERLAQAAEQVMKRDSAVA
ncbi:MAG TPA: wax ester/triacylglycerol synthase family O-acyltransferase [Candidatus Binataceae bacterium]